MKKVLLGFALFCLPPLTAADVLDKSSSFAVTQDATTGVWILECSLSVSGIDRTDTHSVGIHIEYKDYGQSFSTPLYSRTVDLLPTERSYFDSAEGSYQFEIKKVGRKIFASVEVTQNSAYTNDDFTCSMTISSSNLGTLYSFRTNHLIIDSGEPHP